MTNVIMEIERYKDLVVVGVKEVVIDTVTNQVQKELQNWLQENNRLRLYSRLKENGNILVKLIHG